MMARCMMNERQGRPIFFGAMIAEGVVALIWAAAANYAFHTTEGKAFFTSGNAALVVDFVSKNWLGTLGGALAVLGVIAAPITSGDTAFRSARLIIADALKLDQKSIFKRLLVSLPLFVGSSALMFIDFNVIWRYFAWSNQILSTITLWAISIYLVMNRKNVWITFIPALFMTTVVSAVFFVRYKNGLNAEGAKDKASAEAEIAAKGQ